jgi:hypothetical protein
LPCLIGNSEIQDLIPLIIATKYHPMPLVLVDDVEIVGAQSRRASISCAIRGKLRTTSVPSPTTTLERASLCLPPTKHAHLSAYYDSLYRIDRVMHCPIPPQHTSCTSSLQSFIPTSKNNSKFSSITHASYIALAQRGNIHKHFFESLFNDQ